jgi:hypothetical protein
MVHGNATSDGCKILVEESRPGLLLIDGKSTLCAGARDMSRKGYKIVPGAGDICPRCKQATEIREHIEVAAKHLRQAYYFSRWFNCVNKDCLTTLIVSERFKVAQSSPLPA